MSVESVSNSNLINHVDKGSHPPESRETENEQRRAERISEERAREAREREEKDAERCYDEDSSYYENDKGRYVDEVA